MMLHSWKFVLGFLPASVLLLRSLTGAFGSHGLAVPFLVAASYVFACLPGLDNAVPILLSTVFNYVIARAIGMRNGRDWAARLILVIGIATNVSLLAYFKYLDFIVKTLNQALGFSFHLQAADLAPIGLSFLTFQQVAFLVDSYRGQANCHNIKLSHYVLFCSFFPKQVAGPIVRSQEFFPQLTTLWSSLNRRAFLDGMTRFIFGYFEKVVVADTLALYVNPVFGSAEAGDRLGSIAAWGALLAFTFQLYFDFVGYTDMALGAARMMGLTLPENFLSPYNALSISEFWRRWHVTLSRFLRDYLYIPLGGSHKGFVRQLINMMITMLLGGLWHGANWTYVLWGFLHGLYLAVNHSWRRRGWSCPDHLSWGITFASVTYAWVWFRAGSAGAAWRMTQSLIGLQGLWTENFASTLRWLEQPTQGPVSSMAGIVGLLDLSVTYGRWTIHPVGILLSEPSFQFICLVFAAILVWAIPNAQEWLEQHKDACGEKESAAAGAFLACLFFLALQASLHDTMKTFVYSKF